MNFKFYYNYSLNIFYNTDRQTDRRFSWNGEKRLQKTSVHILHKRTTDNHSRWVRFKLGGKIIIMDNPFVRLPSKQKKTSSQILMLNGFMFPVVKK